MRKNARHGHEHEEETGDIHTKQYNCNATINEIKQKEAPEKLPQEQGSHFPTATEFAEKICHRAMNVAYTRKAEQKEKKKKRTKPEPDERRNRRRKGEKTTTTL